MSVYNAQLIILLESFIKYFYIIVFHMVLVRYWFFFFKQKTAYEMRISDWSSDVCSSDLLRKRSATIATPAKRLSPIVSRSIGYQPFGACSPVPRTTTPIAAKSLFAIVTSSAKVPGAMAMPSRRPLPGPRTDTFSIAMRSEEHTSELQSLMRISYAGLCLTK